MKKIFHSCLDGRDKLVAIERDGKIYVKCKGCKQEVAIGFAFTH